MNGVAAKIAIEVVMRFEQRDGDPFSGEQERENDAGRTAANNDTRSGTGRFRNGCNSAIVIKRVRLTHFLCRARRGWYSESVSSLRRLV